MMSFSCESFARLSGDLMFVGRDGSRINEKEGLFQR